MTRVSVVLCCYNGEAFVGQALDSLYRQTLRPDQYEVVFIDDGSTDGSGRVAHGFERHANFRYLRNERNEGLVSACNRGLREARGDYVIRLDADDTFDPVILEEMCRPLDAGLTDFVYCDRQDVVVSTGEVRYVAVGNFDVFRLIAVGTMMRRQLVLEVGGYREMFWEEYDLYIRYLRRSGRAPYYIPRPLLRYAVRQGTMTSDPRRVEDGWREFNRVWPVGVVEQFGNLPSRAGT